MSGRLRRHASAVRLLRLKMMHTSGTENRFVILMTTAILTTLTVASVITPGAEAVAAKIVSKAVAGLTVVTVVHGNQKKKKS